MTDDLHEQLARAAWNALPATPHGWDAADEPTRKAWLDIADALLPLVRAHAADQLAAAAEYWDRPSVRTVAADLRERAATLRQQEPTGFCVCDPGEPRRDCGIPEHRDRAAALREKP
jgi:hypothetical protein